jgi:hypothetical protein
MNKTTPMFKKCGPCGFEWDTLDAFLGDPEIEIIGYQVDFEIQLCHLLRAPVWADGS